MNPCMPARRPWTADEQRKLDDLLEAGKTVVEVAPVLQRTPTSIYAQLQRLEIKKANRMTGAQRRGTNWTPEEDRQLFDLIEAGKSRVFISAKLKRPARTIHDRLSYLRRQAKKVDLDSTVEPALKVKK
jgi:hypothetical protein